MSSTRNCSAAGSLEAPALQFLVLDMDEARVAAAAVDERFLVALEATQPVVVGGVGGGAGGGAGGGVGGGGTGGTGAAAGEGGPGGASGLGAMRAAVASLVLELRPLLTRVGGSAL